MSTQELHNVWGLQPDRPSEAIWGARAIFRDGTIDLLWDRQGFSGPDDKIEVLQDWINKKALPAMRKLAKQRLTPRDNRLVCFEQPGFRIIANPNASFGYLYLCAMMLPSKE